MNEEKSPAKKPLLFATTKLAALFRGAIIAAMRSQPRTLRKNRNVRTSRAPIEGGCNSACCLFPSMELLRFLAR
jgi:hypothetical protein